MDIIAETNKLFLESWFEKKATKCFLKKEVKLYFKLPISGIQFMKKKVYKEESDEHTALVSLLGPVLEHFKWVGQLLPSFDSCLTELGTRRCGFKSHTATC
jgi:hypothetical protein